MTNELDPVDPCGEDPEDMTERELVKPRIANEIELAARPDRSFDWADLVRKVEKDPEKYHAEDVVCLLDLAMSAPERLSGPDAAAIARVLSHLCAAHPSFYGLVTRALDSLVQHGSTEARPAVQEARRYLERESVGEYHKQLSVHLEAIAGVPLSRRLSNLRGLGREIWKGEDAQDYVNRLRGEWE